METTMLHIPNISCGHCVAAIQDELTDISGVSSVKGDSETRTVAVQWDAPANLNIIRQKLKEINYPAD